MSRISSEEPFPEAWRAAYARDRKGAPDYADPAPERRTARMLAAFIITGLCFLTLPGTFLGVWNLLTIAQHRAAQAASTAWIQAHGQAQLLGWVGSFILGISLSVLPKFRGRPLKRVGMGWLVWVLWTAGVALRWWTGITGEGWRPLLVIAAVLELLTFGIFQYVLFFGDALKTQSKPSRWRAHDLGSWLGLTGFSALGLALGINLGIAIFLALHGKTPLYPLKADHTLILIEVWGFAVAVAWGYSTKFVTVFLGLKPAAYTASPWICGGILGIILSAVLRQFWLADLLAAATAVMAVWALRIFHHPAKPAKVIGIYRRYPLFIKLSYAWLLAGSLLGVMADAMPRYIGLGGASRHAITVGFIATLIFALAPRILPSFLNGRELYSQQWMAASLWLLTIGCLLRVSSESVAYSSTGLAWRILPVSAFLELAGVVAFVANMSMTLASPVPAWFSPDGVSATLPLYWYVTSFPKTRSILAQAGLRTLARTRNIPRSLSLSDAARADGANVEHVLADLKVFFSHRQSRTAK